MPRFKPADYGLQFLAVDLSKQLHPGSSENAVSVQANVSWANVKRSGRNQYALHHLIEHEIDLTEIEARYKNEHEGAAAYDPRVLLKIVLLAYSRGIVSSRSMEAACCSEDNLKALEDKGIEAIIPDKLYRQRDPRYPGQEQHTSTPEALWDKTPKPPAKPKLFQPNDFKLAPDLSHCICPAGKRL